MAQLSRYNTLILDLGDVLFTWSATTKTSIPPRQLHAILSSVVWGEYECDKVSQEDCYAECSEAFGVPPDEIATAFRQARESLCVNNALLSLVRRLRKEHGDGLRVFAMSNISASDYEYLRNERVDADWSVFDRVFTSAGAGTRKPNLSFYQHVLQETGADPQRTIFVDDKNDNVLAARSFGIRGVVFNNDEVVAQTLLNLLGDPVTRGQQYLHDRAGRLETFLDDELIKENFTQLLILEATKDKSLVTIEEHKRKWNYFVGEPVGTTATFPYDLDTTSLAFMVTSPETRVVNEVMDEMLQYVNADGIIQTYFDKTRCRTDPVVCVNVLTLFYSHRRGHQLRNSLQWVRNVLLHRAYLDGTRYYDKPESFLFFVHRLITESKDSELSSLLEPILRDRVQERIGVEGDALALAMRLLVCCGLGIQNEVDFNTLLSMQQTGGGWPLSWVYRMGSSSGKISSRGLATAFAINAVRAITDPKSSAAPVSVQSLTTTKAISKKRSTAQPRRKSSISEVADKLFGWVWPRSLGVQSEK